MILLANIGDLKTMNSEDPFKGVSLVVRWNCFFLDQKKTVPTNNAVDPFNNTRRRRREERGLPPPLFNALGKTLLVIGIRK